MSTRFDPPERGPLGPDVATVVTTPIVPPTSESAVSWGAILAGAVAAAALSLILLILGVGLGLSSVSPWSFEGVSKETFGWTSVAWLTFTALAASGLGGYLAGRLRTKWTQIHGDETYFRDTAHGFVSWAVATLLTAGLLTSAIGGVLGAGAKVAGATAGAAVSTAGVAAAGVGTAAAGGQEGDLNYWVDSLFRNAASPGPDAAVRRQHRVLQSRRRATARWTLPHRRRRRRPPPALAHVMPAWPRRRARCRAMARWVTAAKCVPK